MTVLWAVAVIGAVLLIIGVIVVALRVRRAGHAGGTGIRLFGHQPGATGWLTPILDTVAGEGPETWSYEIYTLPTATGRPDLRAELRNPRRDALITVAITSSQSTAESSASDPISVVVSLAGQSQVSGPRRLVQLIRPGPSERRRRRLVALIRRQGSPPPKGELTRARRLALIASVAAIAALGGVVAMAVNLSPIVEPEPGLTSTTSPASPSPATPTSTPTPTATATATANPVVVKGKKPKNAKACLRVYDLGEATPTRSAVKEETTSCEFAEEVRAAYISRGGAGRDITLTKVFSPFTGKLYTMRCRGAHTVKCTGGNDAVVYLY